MNQNSEMKKYADMISNAIMLDVVSVLVSAYCKILQNGMRKEERQNVSCILKCIQLEHESNNNIAHVLFQNSILAHSEQSNDGITLSDPKKLWNTDTLKKKLNKPHIYQLNDQGGFDTDNIASIEDKQLYTFANNLKSAVNAKKPDLGSDYMSNYYNEDSSYMLNLEYLVLKARKISIRDPFLVTIKGRILDLSTFILNNRRGYISNVLGLYNFNDTQLNELTRKLMQNGVNGSLDLVQFYGLDKTSLNTQGIAILYKSTVIYLETKKKNYGEYPLFYIDSNSFPDSYQFKPEGISSNTYEIAGAFIKKYFNENETSIHKGPSLFTMTTYNKNLVVKTKIQIHKGNHEHKGFQNDPVIERAKVFENILEKKKDSIKNKLDVNDDDQDLVLLLSIRQSPFKYNPRFVTLESPSLLSSSSSSPIPSPPSTPLRQEEEEVKKGKKPRKDQKVKKRRRNINNNDKDNIGVPDSSITNDLNPIDIDDNNPSDTTTQFYEEFTLAVSKRSSKLTLQFYTFLEFLEEVLNNTADAFRVDKSKISTQKILSIVTDVPFYVNHFKSQDNVIEIEKRIRAVTGADPYTNTKETSNTKYPNFIINLENDTAILSSGIEEKRGADTEMKRKLQSDTNSYNDLSDEQSENPQKRSFRVNDNKEKSHKNLDLSSDTSYTINRINQQKGPYGNNQRNDELVSSLNDIFKEPFVNIRRRYNNNLTFYLDNLKDYLRTHASIGNIGSIGNALKKTDYYRGYKSMFEANNTMELFNIQINKILKGIYPHDLSFEFADIEENGSVDDIPDTQDNNGNQVYETNTFEPYEDNNNYSNDNVEYEGNEPNLDHYPPNTNDDDEIFNQNTDYPLNEQEIFLAEQMANYTFKFIDGLYTTYYKAKDDPNIQISNTIKYASSVLAYMLYFKGLDNVIKLKQLRNAYYRLYVDYTQEWAYDYYGDAFEGILRRLDANLNHFITSDISKLNQEYNDACYAVMFGLNNILVYLKQTDNEILYIVAKYLSLFQRLACNQMQKNEINKIIQNLESDSFTSDTINDMINKIVKDQKVYGTDELNMLSIPDFDIRTNQERNESKMKREQPTQPKMGTTKQEEKVEHKNQFVPTTQEKIATDMYLSQNYFGLVSENSKELSELLINYEKKYGNQTPLDKLLIYKRKIESIKKNIDENETVLPNDRTPILYHILLESLTGKKSSSANIGEETAILSFMTQYLGNI